MKSYIKNKDVIYTSRSEPIPYNYRISYNVSLICIAIYMCCKNAGCSLIKLNIIYSALYSEEYFEALKKIELEKDFVIRFDPNVNRTIDYAINDDLIIQQKDEKYKLAKKGKELAIKIINDESLLKKEKEILKKINISEDTIVELKKFWGINHV